MSIQRVTPDTNIEEILAIIERDAAVVIENILSTKDLDDIKKETMMAGLSCGEPSLLGWTILSKGVDDFITISDASIPESMRLLAKNRPSI